MAKRWGSQVDFQKIPMLGMVPETSATAPTSPAAMQMWVDTSLTPSRLKIYYNGVWSIVATLDATGKIVLSELPTGTSAGTVALGDHLHTGVYSPVGHAHAAADITSGVFGLARLPVAASGTSSATEIVRADDSRLSNSRTPSGTAGGSLTGSYPNPTIANLAITDAMVAAANKDGVAGTASLRTLGTGAQQALAGNTRLDQISAPTSAVGLGGQRITNLATPTADSDAATKAYVDAARSGLDAKDSVRVATTANIALTGAQTIDGVAVVAGDRVLVKNQTAAAENGIYVAAAGTAWTRAADADSSAEVTSGMFTFVEEGTANDNSGWILTTNGAITLGTTALSFTQFSGAGALSAGAGLLQTGSTFDVVAADGSITVNADNITVGNVPVTKGGTGATTAAAARTNLGTVGRYAGDVPAMSAGVEVTITHGLASTDVQASFRTVSDGRDILFDWRVISTTQIGVTADLAFGANAVRAVVVG